MIFFQFLSIYFLPLTLYLKLNLGIITLLFFINKLLLQFPIEKIFLIKK